MKRLVILQAIVIMLILMAFGSEQAVAAKLVVDDDSVECPTAGFATIGAALAAASSNDTIEVCPGTYFEAVVIILNGITLKGKPAPGAILDGTGQLPADNCITIAPGVSGVTIKDLEIQNCNNRGIRGPGTVALPLSHIKLKDLDIHAVSQVAGDGHAIDFVHAAHVKIKDVAVAVGPLAGFFAEAIRLQSVSPVTVDNVHIVGGFVGVNFACSDPCGDPVPEPPTNGIIKHSTISGTTDNGVLLANTTHAIIDGNVIAGAGFAGIQVGFRAVNPVTGVQIFNNVVTGTVLAPIGHGIALARGSSGSTVKNNIVTGNGTDGIFAGTIVGTGGSTGGNTIDHNVSNGNTGFGYVDDGTGFAVNVFFQNECKANTAGGSDPTGLCVPQT
ncbi:MAG: right-handed parallel beta-helix repeat-containing protein [Candidatus Dadabacteria bacterium]|nr:right-handed parallel beta-helix repeat-containing protein [Candidatus Dadabacteria bacterium]